MLIKRIFWTPQFLRFGLIGVANTLVHGFLLTALVELLSLNVVLSNFFAFLMANIFSFFMNSYFTFKIHPTFHLYKRFLLASLVSLGLTLLIAWVMNYWGFYYLEGFLAIVLIVPALSFLVMKFWAFTIKSGVKLDATKI